jgi:hypothetical protein
MVLHHFRPYLPRSVDFESLFLKRSAERDLNVSPGSAERQGRRPDSSLACSDDDYRCEFRTYLCWWRRPPCQRELVKCRRSVPHNVAGFLHPMTPPNDPRDRGGGAWPASPCALRRGTRKVVGRACRPSASVKIAKTSSEISMLQGARLDAGSCRCAPKSDTSAGNGQHDSRGRLPHPSRRTRRPSRSRSHPPGGTFAGRRVSSQ